MIFPPPIWPGNIFVAIPIIRATSRPRLRSRTRQTGRHAGGCDFPVDPSLEADRAEVWWSPDIDADLLLLVPSPLAGPTRLTAADLPAQRLVRGRGRGKIRLSLLAQGCDGASALAALVPLDDQLPRRLEALARLWRQTNGQAVEETSLSAQRRRRLKAMLRAWDARHCGAPYREIASGLFGAARVAASPWKTSSLRDATMRLVRDAQGMVTGGYQSLLN